MILGRPATIFLSRINPGVCASGLCDQISYPGASKLRPVLTELREVLAIPWEELDFRTKRIFSQWEGAWWHLSFVTDNSHSRTLNIIQNKICEKLGRVCIRKDKGTHTTSYASEILETLILSELVHVSQFHCLPTVKRKQCFPHCAIMLLQFPFFAIPH